MSPTIHVDLDQVLSAGAGATPSTCRVSCRPTLAPRTDPACSPGTLPMAMSSSKMRSVAHTSSHAPPACDGGDRRNALKSSINRQLGWYSRSTVAMELQAVSGHNDCSHLLSATPATASQTPPTWKPTTHLNPSCAAQAQVFSSARSHVHKHGGAAHRFTSQLPLEMTHMLHMPNKLETMFTEGGKTAAHGWLQETPVLLG